MSSVRAGRGHHQWSRIPAQSGVDLNKLHALVLNGVSGEVGSADVVALKESDLHQRSMKLLK
jgi:hypothetical protein